MRLLRSIYRRLNTARVGPSVAAALLAAALAGATGCRSAPPAAKPRPRNVAIQSIVPITEMADTFKTIGKTEPNRTVKVIAEVAGRIENVAVAEGQTVRGDRNDATLIVRLNTDLLQAALDLYRADAEFTKLEFQQLKELYDRDAATQYELERAERQYLMAKARQDSAAAELNRSKIYAPISGVLNSLPVEHGEYIQAGTLVAEIVDVDKIKVVVDVPELDMAYLSVGDQAAVLADLRGREEQFEGEITYISKLADPGTFTSRIEITIDNADGRLLTGKMVDVRLTRRVIRDAIMVPLDAVIPRQYDRVVYVVSPQAELALDVPKAAADSLAEGDEAHVLIVSSVGNAPPRRGNVAKVEDSDNRDTARIHVRFDLSGAVLSAGQVISMQLPGQSAIDAVVGPITDNPGQANDGQTPAVIAELSRFAERRVVELGIMRGKEVQVLSGLGAGDMLIIEGQQYVGPGQRVQIVRSIESRQASADADMGTDEAQ